MAGSSSFSSSITYHLWDEDVEIEILSRLSVKSLLRFKCVCKSWLALIKSPYFITKHLVRNRQALKNGNNALLFITGREEVGDGTRETKPSLTWISSNSNDDDATMPSIDSNSLPFSDGKQIPRTILGPVNGIYCAITKHVGTDDEKDVHRRTNDLFLCNPSLREVKALPKFPREATGRCLYGFGYDSNSNDFKVVAITKSIEYTSNRAHVLVFVYNLSSNSWKQISCDNNFSDLTHESSFFMCHRDGVVHWSALDHIYSFDLGKEVFIKFNLPDAKPQEGSNRVEILNDEITIDDRLRYRNVYYTALIWEVRVMKKYGFEESWTELYVNNAEILFDTVVSKFVKYSTHPKSNKIKVLPIPAHKACNYMESLVSINGDGG